MEKYLYFRTEATDANDDATGDSACFPASSLMGMQPTNDSELTLYFRSITRQHPGGSADSSANLANHDTVVLNLTTANTHLECMKAISRAVTFPSVTGLIIIANDDSDNPVYLLDSGISGCGTITVAPAYTN
tara:strand:+ start:1821 stop:2216 length:396 start_codon:yes stop_codon:yes gene_type:complete